MRIELLIAALVTGSCASLWAQQPAANETKVQSQAIIDAVDGSLAEVFKKFGVPKDVFVSDVKSKAPKVVLDYGGFGFFVRSKKTTCCLFWSTWKGETFRGVKIGDTEEEVTTKLGKKPKSTTRDADTAARSVWILTDPARSLQVRFDETHHRCDRVVINTEIPTFK